MKNIDTTGMKSLNDEELFYLLNKNSKYADVRNELDAVKELDRLNTSREVEYTEPSPDAEGNAKTTGVYTVDLFSGRKTIKVYCDVYLYDYDEESEQYNSESHTEIGWK